jgi:hypothetical protein
VAAEGLTSGRFVVELCLASCFGNLDMCFKWQHYYRIENLDFDSISCYHSGQLGVEIFVTGQMLYDQQGIFGSLWTTIIFYTSRSTVNQSIEPKMTCH